MAKQDKNVPSFDDTEAVNNAPSFDDTISLEEGEKKKSISEPLGLKPLEQSSGQKSSIPSYATEDVHSLSKSDSPTLKSTPLQSDGIKSNYSVTPSDNKTVGGKSTLVTNPNIDMSTYDDVTTLTKKVDKKLSQHEFDLNNLRIAKQKQNDNILAIESEINNPNTPPDLRYELENQRSKMFADYDAMTQSLSDLEKEASSSIAAKDKLKSIETVKKALDAKTESGIEKLGDSFGRGVERLASSLLKTPAFLYDAVATVTNPVNRALGIEEASSEGVAKTFGFDPKQEQLSDVIDADIEKSQEKKQLQFDKTLEQYFSDGQYAKGFEALGNEIAESAPTTIAMMYGNAAGATAAESTLAGGFVFGADKKSELDASNPEMSEADKNINSFATGLMEGLFEQYGVTKLGGVVKNVLTKEGKKQAEKIALDGFKKTYGAVMKKYAGVAGEEMVGEMATQFSQNAIDKYSGADPNKDLMDGVIHAGIVGLGSSVAYTAPIAPLDLLQTKNQKALYEKAQEIKGSKEKLDAFREEIDNTLTPEEAQKVKDKVNEVLVHDEKIPDSIKKTERRVAAVNLLSEKAKLEQEIEGKDKALTVKKRERVDEINSELENIARGNKLPQEEIIESIKTEENAIPVEKTNEVDVRQQAGDGKALGEGNTKPKIVASKEEVINEEAVEPYSYKTTKDEYVVENGGTQGLIIKNKSGIEPSANTKLNVTKDYEKKFDYSKGKKAEFKEGINEADADAYVAETSENPRELIELHDRIIKDNPVMQSNDKERIISENIGKVKQKGKGGYDNFGDSNNITQGKALSYFSEKSGEPIDTLAQRISEDVGYEITPQDVIDFIDAYPNGISDYIKATKNPVIQKVADRFKEITGLTLNDRVKEASLSQQEKQILNKQYTDYAELEREYTAAIERGDIVLDESGEIKISVPVEGKVEEGTSDEEKVVPPPVKPPVNDGKTPSLPAGERVRALATELSEAKGISKEIKDKIKEIGLRSDTFSHAEAKDIANYLIEERGVAEAVELADKQLKGSVKFFVFGAAIDHYSKMIEEAKTPEEKELYAELGAEVGMLADSYAEDAGRFISAIGEYYKNHPDIIAKRETKKLNARNEKIIKDKVATSENIDAVKKEFDKLKNDFEKEVEKGVNEEFNKIGEKLFGKEVIEKVDKVADDIIAQIKGGTFASIIPPPVLIGAVNTIRLAIKGGMGLANAIQSGIDYIKEKFTDFDEKELTQKLTKVFEKEIPKEVVTSKKEVKIPKEKSKSELVKEQERILNKYFPKKRLESEIKRKQLHEKIIDQYNAGVFEGGVNKEGKTFESLFYEKLGLVNPNTKEFQSKLKGFVDKMAKAEEGSIMWREVNEEMLNYIANIAYETKLASGASKLDAMWYANILSSPATHLRNAQYNMIQTRILNPLLLAEKALVNGNPKEAAKIFADMFKRINLPFTEKSKEKTAEARRAFWTGKGSRFDNVMAQSILERSGGKLFKLIPYKAFTIPGRGLRAADIQSTQRAYNLKLEEQAREIIKKQFPGASFDEVNTKVNELIGNTEERKIVAREKAQKEIEKFYGEDWAKVPQVENIKKIREFELMEQSMPEELKAKKDEIMDWSKKSVLTNKPTGIYGAISDIVKMANDKLWFTKFVVPFINVPLNVTQKLIDKTPIGLVKRWRGKEGFGKNETELNVDQKQELLLKSINYTLAMTAFALMNGDDDDDDLVITGEQTGNYTDNKGVVRGGKLEPYSVYIKGKKVLSYKTTPLAAVFLPAGYIRDYKVYGKNEGALAATSDMAYNYLAFVNDQSAMQGIAGIFEGVKDASKTSVEKAGSTLAKMMSGLVPYSGAVKYITNTTNALTGQTDKRPIDWYENIYRDLPFATYAMETRTDHFGQPVKETFDIPLVPVGDRGLLAEMSDKSKYYKLTSDHKYMPKYENDKKFYVGGKEVDINKKELNALNVRRGELVKDALDSKNVFYLRNGGSEDKKESKMTTYDYLNTLDNEEFKTKMDLLFNAAFKRAKLEKFGETLGITATEMKKYLAKIEAMKKEGEDIEDEELKDKTKNKKELEEMKEIKNLSVPLDDY